VNDRLRWCCVFDALLQHANAWYLQRVVERVSRSLSRQSDKSVGSIALVTWLLSITWRRDRPTTQRVIDQSEASCGGDDDGQFAGQWTRGRRLDRLTDHRPAKRSIGNQRLTYRCCCCCCCWVRAVASHSVDSSSRHFTCLALRSVRCNFFLLKSAFISTNKHVRTSILHALLMFHVFCVLMEN